MTDRNKRGIRSAGMRARLAIAAAVLVGGGTAGVLVVSTSHSATTAQSTAYAVGYRHTISEPRALTAAFSDWAKSPGKSLTTLDQMTPMRSFSQVRVHGVTLAAQRGIVVLATRKFLVVKSANGSLHLWWLSRATRFRNVDATASGMAAMTGSDAAAAMAMATGDLTPAATVMAGSTRTLAQLATPTAKPATITIDTGGRVITITIVSSTATVTQPMTVTTSMKMTGPMTRGTQPAFRPTMGVRRGDLVFVGGTRVHGVLIAKIVLFAAPTATMPAPGMSASPSPSATATPSPGTTFSGTHT